MKESEKERKELKQYLRELHLPAIRGIYEGMAEKAVKETWGYESYLYELVSIECEERRNRKVERLISESRLPLSKSITTFDRARIPLNLNQHLNTLLTGCFVDRHENILVFGRPGSGKTHLVCAIGHELIRKERRVLFTTCNLLVQELLRSKHELRFPQLLKKLNRYEVLILDDIGYVQQSRDEMEVLFSLLAERYEQGSVIVTSNLPFSKWDTIFKDPMLAAAAIDRLIHHSIIIELNVESYRVETAKKRMDRQNISVDPNAEKAVLEKDAGS